MVLVVLALVDRVVLMVALLQLVNQGQQTVAVVVEHAEILVALLVLVAQVLLLLDTNSKDNKWLILLD